MASAYANRAATSRP